jgi:hypothetical protein
MHTQRVCSGDGRSSSWLRLTPEAQAIYDEGVELGHMSLRRAQYHAAVRGNVVAQIWLGKNWLGQKDVVQGDVKVEVRSDEALKALRAEIDAMVPRLAPPGTTTGERAN